MKSRRWLAVLPACLLLATAGCEQEHGDQGGSAGEGPGAISRTEAEQGLGDALRGVSDSHQANPGLIPTGADADRASDIHEFITRAYGFPDKVYWAARAGGAAITVYGLIEEARQDAVLDLLRDEQGKRGWGWIEVRFKRAEVLQRREVEGGGVMTVRGEEEVLRRVVLDAD